MGTIKKILFRWKKEILPPNLFIGGVSSVVNTPALLSAKFTFLESEVDGFTIDGNDIYATINNTNYTALEKCFRDDLTITSFKETDGYLTVLGVQAFRGCTALVLLDAIGVTTFYRELVFGCSLLHIKDILLPNVITMNAINSAFTGINISLGETLNFPLATTLTGSNTFRFFRYTINLPECTTFGSVDTCAFGNGILNIPKVTNLGGTVLDNSVFRLCSSGLVINVNTAQQTINAGSPDGDLTYASGRGATINYI